MKILEIKNLYTIAEDDHNKEILKGLNLEINKGEIHVIMGPNGSGKSTLANTIMSSPRYIKTKGSISFLGEDITNKETDYIARQGIFMTFQSPIDIEGITLANFLKSTKENITNEKVSVYELSKNIKNDMDNLSLDNKYLSRDFNVGFSGGERKKNEILQLNIINPSLAILDEIDSGLDVDAIKKVSQGINKYKNDDNSLLIITHSTKLLKEFDNYIVHILIDGKIVDTGDKNLALKIDKEGFSSYEN